MMDERIALDTYHFSHGHRMLKKIILAGLREANANGYPDIALKLSHFFFDNNNIIDHHKIWENNAANAIVLNVNIDDRKPLENQRISPGNDECASQITFDLHSCLELTHLELRGRCILGKDSASVGTLEFPVCIILNIADPTQCTELPPVLPSIKNIRLTRVTCSCTWLRSLFSMMLTHNCDMYCTLYHCHLTACGEGEVNASYTTGDIYLHVHQNKRISISLDDDTGLWEILHGLSIKSLSLDCWGKSGCRVNHEMSFSQTISSLSKLEELSILDIEMDELTPGVWEALRGLNIKSLTLSRKEWGELHAESLTQLLSSLKRLETLGIGGTEDSPDPWKALHGLNIKSLRLDGWQGEGLRINHSEPLSQSLSSFMRLQKLDISVDEDITGLWEAFYGLNIKKLCVFCNCIGKYKESLSHLLASLSRLETLSIGANEACPGLWEALKCLSVKSLTIKVRNQDFELNHTESLSQSLSSLTQLETLGMEVWEHSTGHLETLSIDVEHESPGLWEALHGQNIKSLSLSCVRKSSGIDVKHAETFSQSLSSLTQLETLTLHVHTYIALQVPQSLKYLNIYSDTMLPSKVRELVDSLAIYTHSIWIKLEFGCASSIDPPERIPVQEYIPFQQELAARKNVAIKRFRIYELPDSAGYAMSVRDIGDVDDAASDILEDDVYKRFAKYIDRYIINRISILIEISPGSIS
ncbi:hypothetical protein DPMN_172272 [Dreissena polymorpha]|uniref:Uncharacterized protein n=1 Tax=Dreissena polymorpha TaxID=45954 RepID=A0A9D4E3B2_DREPO|nr:hypothetical protein DPMN_172272 [Dreissena polymorpha]